VLASLLVSTTIFADDADVIDYRKDIMLTMDSQQAALAMMLQKKVPAESFNVLVEMLSITAATALKSFEEKVQGGESKPAVWDKWADFSKRMKEFATSTAELSKIAQSGGMTAAAPKFQALSCKACHDDYRAEKSK
jgi:cytochrome c556